MDYRPILLQLGITPNYKGYHQLLTVFKWNKICGQWQRSLEIQTNNIKISIIETVL